jgi:ribonuclease D
MVTKMSNQHAAHQRVAEQQHIARAQGRVRHSSYPASRVVGLKHDTKLTADDAHEIRRTYRYRSKDANMRVLAERFGVSVNTIYKIIRNKIWRFTAAANAPLSQEPRNYTSRRMPTRATLAKASHQETTTFRPKRQSRGLSTPQADPLLDLIKLMALDPEFYAIVMADAGTPPLR